MVIDSGAAVIGFQEVRFSDGAGGELGPNQAQHLADRLPQYQVNTLPILNGLIISYTYYCTLTYLVVVSTY